MVDRHDNRADRLVAEVVREANGILRNHNRGPLDPRVAAALRRVPRERFVAETLRADAYTNHPLPIGCGQTISQPLIVAIMTELLDLAPEVRVLDVGSGSGYQAAVLAELAGAVYCLELEADLLAEARRRLTALRYDNLSFRCGNGWFGWPEAAPFDAILVAAAAPEPPDRLLAQLAPGGRMVVPVDAGPERGNWLGRSIQRLVRFECDAAGRLHRQDLFDCAFVPFRNRPG